MLEKKKPAIDAGFLWLRSNYSTTLAIGVTGSTSAS